jgi:hypothetical protein
LEPLDDEAADGGRGLMDARQLKERNAMSARKRKDDAKTRQDARASASWNVEENHRNYIKTQAHERAAAAGGVITRGRSLRLVKNPNKETASRIRKIDAEQKREDEERESKNAEEKATREAEEKTDTKEKTVKEPTKGSPKRKR